MTTTAALRQQNFARSWFSHKQWLQYLSNPLRYHAFAHLLCPAPKLFQRRAKWRIKLCLLLRFAKSHSPICKTKKFYLIVRKDSAPTTLTRLFQDLISLIVRNIHPFSYISILMNTLFIPICSSPRKSWCCFDCDSPCCKSILNLLRDGILLPVCWAGFS